MSAVRDADGATLKRTSGEPLFAQVSDYVRERVYDRTWGVDEPIPSEYELCELLGVSRGTVKQGIRTLVDEGLLVAERGRGTFVAKPLMARPSQDRLLSFAESMEAADISYKTTVVSLSVEPATRECARELEIPVGSDHLFLTRVRSVASRPVMFIESHLNLLCCPGLEKTDFTCEGVFSAVERTSGRKVGDSEMSYMARVAGKTRGAALECDEHAPVLNITQLVRLEDGTPFEWGSVWLPANRCVIVSETKRA